MKKFILIVGFLIAIILFSCTDKVNSKKIKSFSGGKQYNSSQKIIKANEIYEEPTVTYPYQESILTEYKYSHFIDIDVRVRVMDTSSYYVSWTIKDKEFKYDKLINHFPAYKSQVYWYNDDCIILEYGCGSNCFLGCILDYYKNTTKINYYFKPMAIDTVNYLIFYDLSNNDCSHRIENFKTNKGFNINPTECDAIMQVDCVLKAKIENKKLYIDWGYVEEVCPEIKQQIIELPEYLFEY